MNESSFNQSIFQGIAAIRNFGACVSGVLWMCGTLILVIAFVLMPPFCKLSYAYGPILASWSLWKDMGMEWWVGGLAVGVEIWDLGSRQFLLETKNNQNGPEH